MSMTRQHNQSVKANASSPAIRVELSSKPLPVRTRLDGARGHLATLPRRGQGRALSLPAIGGPAPLLLVRARRQKAA